MFKWILIALVFIGGTAFLLKQRKILRESIPASSGIDQTMAGLSALSPGPNEVQQALPSHDPAKGVPLAMSPETRKMLYVLADDVSDKVRWTAVELIYLSGDPNASAVIKTRLSRENETWVKVNIAHLLGQHKDKENLRLLALALDDIDGEVRLAAVDSLSAYDNDEAVPLLTKALKDSETEVKLKAIEAIKNINSILSQRKKSIDARLAQKAAEALAAAKSQAAPAANEQR